MFNSYRYKEYRSEEEILFSAAAHRLSLQEEDDGTPPGTTFAGTGKVTSESLTPNPQKANRLRTQKYW